MDDNQKSNAWDSLIDDLGAKPDESAYERHQPPAQELPPTVEDSETANLPRQIKASPSDWNSLAESLGLEAEEPLALEPDVEKIAVPEVKAQPQVAAIDEPEPNVPAAANLSELLDGFATLEQPKKAFKAEPQDSAANDDLPPLPSKIDEALNDTAWNDESDESEAGETSTADGDDDDEGISGEAARSAFDALFSDGASSWGSAFLEKPKRDDLTPRSKPRMVDDVSLDEPFELLDANEGDTEEGTEEDAERPKRKRSRRRRRGGKGRNPPGEPVAEGEDREEIGDDASGGATDEFAEEVSTDEVKKPRRRRSGQRSRPTETTGQTDLDDEMTEDDDDDDEGDSDPSREGGQGRTRHRNLPTWSDAIGMIVDANLEQRAKSPSKPQSSRGGRSGRRRGKKPESN